MTKEEFFEDYLKVCSMNAPTRTKVGMLTSLFSAQPDTWRVVGITKQALIIFKKYKFTRKSKMGINRSHIVSRTKIYTEMMQRNFKNCDEWWEFYFENDKTILATSSENMSSSLLEYYEISEDAKLFKAVGYAWMHGDKEQKFLKKLFKEKIAAQNSPSVDKVVGIVMIGGDAT